MQYLANSGRDSGVWSQTQIFFQPRYPKHFRGWSRDWNWETSRSVASVIGNLESLGCLRCWNPSSIFCTKMFWEKSDCCNDLHWKLIAYLLKKYISQRTKLNGPLFCHYPGKPVTRSQFSSVLNKDLTFMGIGNIMIRSHSRGCIFSFDLRIILFK
jgi:hypothetical protein